MEESKIIRRYNCDSCRKLFEDDKGFHLVEVNVMRQGEFRGEIVYDKQYRIMCDECLKNS